MSSRIWSFTIAVEPVMPARALSRTCAAAGAAARSSRIRSDRIGGRWRWERGASTRRLSAARVCPQAPEHRAVVRDEVVSLGRLEHFDHVAEPRVGHDATEWRRAERSLRDEFVAVAAGIERRLRIIEMQAAQAGQAEDAVPRLPHTVVIAHQVVPRTVEVARVGAEGETVSQI